VKPWIYSPNSVAIERKAILAVAHRAKRLDWQVAARIVTYGRVVGAIHSFAPFKIPCMEWIFPALLQERREVLFLYLTKIFRACLTTGKVPGI
jgi:hypothetical protein